MGVLDDYAPAGEGSQGLLSDYRPLRLPAETPPAPSWSQVPVEAAKNLVPSAKEFGKGLYHTVRHPVETVESIGMIGRGALAHLGLADEKYKPYADAVGKMLMDRYGSMDAFKRTLASDPVGVAADLSTVLSGGELAAARLPSVAGKLGMAARAVDPLVGATKAVGLAGKGAGKIAASAVGNLGTFTGAVPLEEAAKAGFAGGKRAEAFREGLRGDNINEAVKEATRAIDKMKADRSAAYAAKMQQLGSNPAVLGFNDIDQALIDASKIGVYKGQVTSKSAQKTASAIGDIVNDWKTLNPTDFHTAEGLDALKQKIWDEVVSGIPYEDAKARKVGMDIYHSIKDTITKQDPTYANIMGDYQKAQEILNEMRGELSLGSKNPSTTLRKLQSAMRHNVNTNFGRRKELVDTLAAKEPALTSRLAGHALESWTPVGLGKYLMGPELIAAMSSPVGWKALGLAPLTSPRLMGETAYWGGVGARKAAPVGSILSYRGSPVALPGRLTEHSPLLGVMPAAAEEDKGHRYGGAVGKEDPEDEGKVRYHRGVGGLAIRRGDGGFVPDVDDYEERLQGALPRYNVGGVV